MSGRQSRSAAPEAFLAVVAIAVVVWVWAVGELSGWVVTGRWTSTSVGAMITVVRRLPSAAGDPARAWPPGSPVAAAGAVVFYAWAAVVAAVTLAAGRLAARLSGSRRRWAWRGRTEGARWAGRGDLGPLMLPRWRRRGSVPSGRLVIGRSLAGRSVATEARHSLLVLGPTQSGKTTGLAIPAILEWQGPVVATSVKDDLAASTMAWRARFAGVAVFDPTGASGAPRTDRWSPLSGCAQWAGAQKMAAWLVDSTPGRKGLADAAFWYSAAAKQLAPLMTAAAFGGYGMGDVVRWTDAQDFGEPLSLLELAGEGDAALALRACAGRDERIRSSVATTLETVLAPFEDPVVAAATAETDFSVAALIEGRGTLYLCGPSHEQNRVQGLFAALVSSVVAAALSRVAQSGEPLDPPLLLVLDEAANIAPVRDLDTLASTAAGLGIQLVTVCQDLAQLSARYEPERARTIANNHRAKLLLSGVSDLGTLDLISGLAGEQAVRERTDTQDLRDGRRSRSTSTVLRRLAPSDQLRRVPPGEGVLVYGHLPPARLRLRPWFADRELRGRAATTGVRGR